VSDLRTVSNANALVEGLSEGIPLRQLCRENGFGKSAVYQWIAEDAELSGRIACARAQGYDAIADETMEIADDLHDEPASRRVRVETRLKLLAKWDPKRYGDKVLMGSDPENPLPSGVAIHFKGKQGDA